MFITEKTNSKINVSVLVIALSILFVGCVSTKKGMNSGILMIKEQGSFAVGGSIITNPGKFDPIKRTPEGQTFHGDHAYITYQIPADARKLPLVFWHGIGQFSKPGKLLLTVEKVLIIFFSDVDLAFI